MEIKHATNNNIVSLGKRAYRKLSVAAFAQKSGKTWVYVFIAYARLLENTSNYWRCEYARSSETKRTTMIAYPRVCSQWQTLTNDFLVPQRKNTQHRALSGRNVMWPTSRGRAYVWSDIKLSSVPLRPRALGVHHCTRTEVKKTLNCRFSPSAQLSAMAVIYFVCSSA